MTMLLAAVDILVAFLVLRICQRVYYMLQGQAHYYSYSPTKEMELFIKSNGIASTKHELKSTHDKVTLRYRRLGNGKKYILLANGVGTNFFMWLPFLRELIKIDPTFFDKYTLIVQSYRGLFPPDDSAFKTVVDISVNNCVEDINDMMRHAKVESYESIIGWSTGAQVALACYSKYPKTGSKLFLLNPSAGRTLHSVLQPVIQLPLFIGKIISCGTKALVGVLKPLIPTKVWDILKVVAHSTGFRIALECAAFLGGFPPEQPVYFHEYMRDVFFTRSQTRGLLDLILCLDDDLPDGSTVLPHRTTILSGFPDFITGVYHSRSLVESMPNAKHVCFTMGSHFLLIEWPALVAKNFIEHIHKQ